MIQRTCRDVCQAGQKLFFRNDLTQGCGVGVDTQNGEISLSKPHANNGRTFHLWTFRLANELAVTRGHWGNMTGKFALVPVSDIELDRTNPRIRRFLEIHKGEPTYEQIALALDVANAGADEQGATTPEKLRNSILTNGGIMQPIIVHKQSDGRLVCIEGNTRLYIYRAFLAEEVEGSWSAIRLATNSSPRMPTRSSST